MMLRRQMWLCVLCAAIAVTVASLAPAAPAKEFRLTAKEVTWEILPGVRVQAMTLDGMIPGPEIRVREGDLVRVTVRNELKEPTSLHWHGIDVPNAMDGVPGVTQPSIAPGEEFTYEFVAKPAGVRFYHAHADVAVQMTNAMHGAFIIEPAAAVQAPPRHYILFLTEWTTSGSATGMGGMEPNYYTINGKAFPATAPLRVKEGERVRIILINMGTLDHPMHLHGHQFTIAAWDGNEVPEAARITRNTLPLQPGESADIEFVANNPGVWLLHCHEPHHIMNNGKEPGGLIALVVYDGYEGITAKLTQPVPAAREGTAEMKPMGK